MSASSGCSSSSTVVSSRPARGSWMRTVSATASTTASRPKASTPFPGCARSRDDRVALRKRRTPNVGGTMSTQETGHITGTKDKDYNILWFTEACLSNALRLEIYIQDAERAGDTELADFFRKAQADSRKGGEQGKAMLKKRLS